MKILFAGGGTGGHINPALSIANYIKKRDKNFEALFIGTRRGLEKKLVPGAGYNIEYIDIQGFDRRNMLKNIAVMKKLFAAQKRCRGIIKEFKPDCVVCTGGYVSGPVAIAAKKLGVPSVIHEQNVYPGLTVKGSEKYVTNVLVSFEETVNHMSLPEKCVVTGNPVRPEILEADRETARREMGLKKPMVLIFGGSLGADKINNTVVGMLERIVTDANFSVIFGTGDRNYDNVMNKIAEENIPLSENITITPYINDMHRVMAAADLVVARSGAITVSEIAALGKPSILIPSPNVVRNHQEQNAREFEAKGAARVIVESELTPDRLYEEIRSIIGNKAELEKMSVNVKELAKPDALDKIYEIINNIRLK